MKRFLGIVFLIVTSLQLSAQLDSTKLVVLEQAQDVLKQLGDTLVLHEEFEVRKEANYNFIKQLTGALKTENSFEYEFPELKMLSIKNAPDNTFRIFTWQLANEAQQVRHFGAIQMNTPELKLIPLQDRSDDIKTPKQYVGDNKGWFGALYYNIEKEKKGKNTYYFLFGIDVNTVYSRKKIIDVLQFKDDGGVSFGAKLFPSLDGDLTTNSRFILEYKSDASTTVRYDKKLKRVVFDHLTALSGSQQGSSYAYYVPDGTFDALRWKQGKWVLEKDIIETSFENLEELENNDTPRPKKSDDLYRPNKPNQ